MRAAAVGLSLLLALAIALPIGADPIVYPAKDQSKDQQSKDEYECYTWAKGQTGFDPMKQPTASEPMPEEGAKKGGVVSGAAKGALIGVAAGAIAGDAGKGAAIGAASGGLIGGMRRRNQRKETDYDQQKWADEQAARYQQQRSEYERAWSACLEGRGYTVK